MSNDRLTPFPLLNLEWPDIPPRSRLYPLEPIGLGTAEVESLTSYLTRLANAHRVSVNQLAHLEFATHLNQNAEYTFNQFTQRPLNGNAGSTRVTIEVLETLTLRHDLCFLTMYPWRYALARSKLLHHHLAWCPACYHSWQQSGQTIYHPLQWALEVVQICPHHQQALHHRCPHPACQKRLPLVNNKGQMGYCPFCQRWLGSGSEVTGENVWPESEWDWQVWVTDRLREMLTTVQNSPLEFQRHRVIQNIRAWLRVAASKSISKLADEMGIPAGRLFGWITNEYLPELGLLARVCYHLDLTLLDILTTQPDLQIGFGQSESQHPLGYQSQNLGKQKIEANALGHQLERFLPNPQTPPCPAYQVAQQLGVSHTTLRYFCPEQYQQIVVHYQQYQQTQRQLRTEKLRNDLKTFLESEEIPPPSLSEVARRLQIHRTTAQWSCPELCRLISEKHKTYQRFKKLDSGRDLNEKLTLHETPSAPMTEPNQFPEISPDRLNRPQPYETGKMAALKTALQTILTDQQNPPLSLIQVARQLGYEKTEALRKHFPDLCHQIHQRYQTSRHQIARSTLETVLADNPEPPPTLKEISQQLGYSAHGLKRLWPDLCQAILEKRQHYQDGQTLAREQALKAVLEEEETPPISLKQIAAQFGCAPHTVSKYFPDLAAAVSEKYKAYRRQKTLQRQQQLAEDVKRMTGQLHREGIEPTLRQIMLRLPYPKLIFMPYIREAWCEARRELGLPT